MSTNKATAQTARPKAAVAGKPAAVTSRPAPAAAAKPAAPAAEKQGSVSQTPSIDMAALVVERGVARGQARVRSEWGAKLKELAYKDDSIFVPEKKSSQLSYVKKTAEKLGMQVTIETVDGGARIFRDDGPEFTEGDDGLDGEGDGLE